MKAKSYYRATEISRMKRLMRYDGAAFKEDWETAVALAALMAIHGPLEGQEDQLESCFMRIHAYLTNFPEARPWEESIL